MNSTLQLVLVGAAVLWAACRVVQGLRLWWRSQGEGSCGSCGSCPSAKSAELADRDSPLVSLQPRED